MESRISRRKRLKHVKVVQISAVGLAVHKNLRNFMRLQCICTTEYYCNQPVSSHQLSQLHMMDKSNAKYKGVTNLGWQRQNPAPHRFTLSTSEPYLRQAGHPLICGTPNRQLDNFPFFHRANRIGPARKTHRNMPF